MVFLSRFVTHSKLHSVLWSFKFMHALMKPVTMIFIPLLNYCFFSALTRGVPQVAEFITSSGVLVVGGGSGEATGTSNLGQFNFKLCRAGIVLDISCFVNFETTLFND